MPEILIHDSGSPFPETAECGRHLNPEHSHNPGAQLIRPFPAVVTASVAINYNPAFRRQAAASRLAFIQYLKSVTRGPKKILA
jgi:hypothetical protein